MNRFLKFIAGFVFNLFTYAVASFLEGLVLWFVLPLIFPTLGLGYIACVLIAFLVMGLVSMGVTVNKAIMDFDETLRGI